MSHAKIFIIIITDETDSDDDFCTPLTQIANDARVDKARMPPPSLMKGQAKKVATKNINGWKIHNTNNGKSIKKCVTNRT